MNESLTVAVDRDIIDLAASFLSNRRGQVQDWREAVTTGNYQVLWRLGHELKGTAGAFGFHRLSELGAELEEILRNNDPAEVGDRIERIVVYLERVTIVPR